MPISSYRQACGQPGYATRNLAGWGERSLVTVPLMADRQLMGVLSLVAEGPGGNAPERAHIVEEVMRAVAMAFQQLQLWETLERQGECVLAALQEQNVQRQVNLSGYVHNLIGKLFRVQKVNPIQVKARLNVQPMTVEADLAVLCGLMIHELVSNALQHAFPDCREGAVYVALHRQQERYTLVVRDDGVGLSADLDLRDPGSPGLALVRRLVQELEAEVAWETGPGTRVQITFAAPRSQEER